MSFVDPNTNPPDPWSNGPPKGGQPAFGDQASFGSQPAFGDQASFGGQPAFGSQPPNYSPPDSFAIPLVQGNLAARQIPQRRRGPRLGCLISLIVLVALLFASYATFAHTWGIFGPTTISFQAHQTLVINSQHYSEVDLPTISIHAGTDNSKMIFQVMSPGNIAFPWNFGIGGFQQNSDSSVIILNGDPVSGRKLDITVPADTDLKVTTNSTNINVTGITGQMTFITNSGAITLTNCHVTGTSLLSDNTGAITVTQSALNGQVTLNNNQGPISFASSIGSTGTYTLVNLQGSIDVTLPQNASFHIDAATNSGSITSDYTAITVQNKGIHADVGQPPHALLSLKTNSGNITLHMQRGA
jgi:hypothetical protein